MRKISPPPRFDPRTVQPVGSRYTLPGPRLDETNCSVSCFSPFFPDLSPEKEVDVWWCPGLTVRQWGTELFLPFPEIKLQFFSNSSNRNFLCMLTHPPPFPQLVEALRHNGEVPVSIPGGILGSFQVTYPFCSHSVVPWR